MINLPEHLTDYLQGFLRHQGVEEVGSPSPKEMARLPREGGQLEAKASPDLLGSGSPLVRARAQEEPQFAEGGALPQTPRDLEERPQCPQVVRQAQGLPGEVARGKESPLREQGFLPAAQTQQG